MFNEEELKRCCCEKQESMEQQQELVKYEDVFPVSGELASEPQLLAQLLIKVVGSFVHPESAQWTKGQVPYGGDGGIIIGEALEAIALTAVDKPVDQSDAAAIQAAEVRATRRNVITPSGVAAVAQAAATFNAHVLTVAAVKLPADKKVTRRDAEGVVGAEMKTTITSAARQPLASTKLASDPESKSKFTTSSAFRDPPDAAQ
ncbi:hypothetical protein MKX01_020484 [Papaver californicum]|nr:hypothetical protein MKX01_020484 [Papaver californicum]